MDEAVLTVIRDISAAAAHSGTRALLVGAHAVGLVAAPLRQTADIDFALVVESWARVDAFFDACTSAFQEVRRADLTMRHRNTRMRVDVIPCGAIEHPPGSLLLRDASRRLDNTGLTEIFAFSEPSLGASHVLVPSVEALLVIKLFAWHDRRAAKDLGDIGAVLRAAPRGDDDAMYADERFLTALATNAASYEDWPAWRLGRQVRRRFARSTADAVASVATVLVNAPARERAELIPHGTYGGLDQRVRRADELLGALEGGLLQD